VTDWPRFRITSKSARARDITLEFNGEDISRWCHSLRLVGVADDVIRVELELLAGEVDIDVQGRPRVTVSPALARLLEHGGWRLDTRPNWLKRLFGRSAEPAEEIECSPSDSSSASSSSEPPPESPAASATTSSTGSKTDAEGDGRPVLFLGHVLAVHEDRHVDVAFKWPVTQSPDTANRIPHLSNFQPAVGDRVWFLLYGPDLRDGYVLDRISDTP
jgi:hypothetical protein